MYYYIFEPHLEAKEYERVAHIKNYLSELGIAGEITSPTPARNVEDLVELAVGKRYSTIVAVGGINLINQVARALEPYDTVFGIIPLREHSDIEGLIGVRDWKSAADHLKRRRLQSVQLGLINESICFLTPATITLTREQSYTIRLPKLIISGNGGTISISPGRTESSLSSGLSLYIQNIQEQKPGLFGFFSKSSPLPSQSNFTISEMQIETSSVLPVYIAGEEVLTTPLTFSTQEKALKLIIAKGTS